MVDEGIGVISIWIIYVLFGDWFEVGDFGIFIIEFEKYVGVGILMLDGGCFSYDFLNESKV